MITLLPLRAADALGTRRFTSSTTTRDHSLNDKSSSTAQIDVLPALARERYVCRIGVLV